MNAFPSGPWSRRAHPPTMWGMDPSLLYLVVVAAVVVFIVDELDLL